VPSAMNDTKQASDALQYREIKFCEYILQGLNQTQAYKKAGYKGQNPSAIRSGASEIAHKPNVIAYIATARKQVVEDLQLDRNTIHRRLLMIGMGLVDEEVVVTTWIGKDEDGNQRGAQPLIVKKKMGGKEQIAALTYLDKVISESREEDELTLHMSTDDRLVKALNRRQQPMVEVPDQMTYEEDDDANEKK